MSKKTAYYGLFAALALLMGYVESLFPLPLPIPGIKLGLANIIILMTLYVMGEKSAFFIAVIKIFLSSLLFSGFAGFLYSAAGAMLSLLVMLLAKRCKSISIIGISVLGGVFHNTGQLAVAAFLLETPQIVYYLPPLIAAGVATGLFTGVAAKAALKSIKKLN